MENNSGLSQLTSFAGFFLLFPRNKKKKEEKERSEKRKEKLIRRYAIVLPMNGNHL